MSLKLSILGLPGAGKGTQAKKLSETYDIPHISMGDILRGNRDYETADGRTVNEIINAGESVPTETTAALLGKRVKQPDCENGFVIDGFPRFRENAEVMGDVADLDAILIINVDEEEIYARLTNRRICPDCGEHYHLKFDPPQEDEKCDECSTGLVQREDDTRERIAERIKWQREGLEEIRDFYKDTDMIVEVDGNASIDEVWNRVQEAVRPYAD